MSKKEEKITIKKKMSNRDFISLAYYLEDKEIPSFEGKDATYLAKVETRYMRVTREGKEKIDKFLNRFILGVSADALFDEIPCIKKPFVPPSQQVMVQQPIPTPQQVPQQVPQIQTPQPAADIDSILVNLSDDDKWEWAKSDRQRDVDCDQDKQTSPKDFPFVIDYSKPIDTKNIDFDMMFYMLEHGKIGQKEIVALFNTNNARRMIDIEPSIVLNGSRFKRYSTKANLYCAMQDAEHVGTKYLNMLDEPEPSLEDTLKRYKNYIAYQTKDVFPRHARFDSCTSEMDLFVGAEGNKLNFSTVVDEEFDEELDTMQLEYDSYESLMVDLVRFTEYYKFSDKIDCDQKFNVFDKTISVNKFIADIYKKYPRGWIEGKVFYRTSKEAYDEGALTL